MEKTYIVLDSIRLKKADLVCDDIRVLNLLIRLGYLVENNGVYYLTEQGINCELGTAQLPVVLEIKIGD